MPNEPINFHDELKKIKPLVWDKIKNYLPDKEPTKHYQMVREYPERQGKYFRPALVLWSTAMFGGKVKQALLTAATMQTSEDWLLIHDDFEDHSEERRHKPALNQIHGDEMAVNAGDALHIIMWKILGDNVRFLGNKIGWQIFDKMYDILSTTIEGQYLELSWITEKKVNLSEAEYYDLINRKAGYYTVIGPLQLGAIIAGVTDEKNLAKIKAWGLPLGCAFQIWDDVMNLTVSNTKQGKERGGDILEGKRTLILIHLLKNCTLKERQKVEETYNKPRVEKTKEEVDYILDLMEKYQSIAYAGKVAKDFSNQAKKIFKKNTASLPDSEAKKIIEEGIGFVVNRES
jgi:geranylgeranyl diphosphate synthase type II